MGGLDYGGLNDGYNHCQVKLKKYKTSENEQSHGSFFLRVGGLGKNNILLNIFTTFALSIRSWNYGLRWIRVWILVRNSLGLSLLPSHKRS